jgi:predicted site-specific integrase-resolvase
VLQREWAARKGVTERTASRYRRAGLLAYLEWAGKVWIDDESGDELLRSRVKRRNPPRQPRRLATEEAVR